MHVIKDSLKQCHSQRSILLQVVVPFVAGVLLGSNHQFCQVHLDKREPFSQVHLDKREPFSKAPP